MVLQKVKFLPVQIAQGSQAQQTKQLPVKAESNVLYQMCVFVAFVPFLLMV